MRCILIILLFASCGFKKPFVTVQNTNDNTVYKGIPNLLDVYCCGSNCKRIVLKSKDGELVKTERSRNLQYLFSPSSDLNASIEIYDKWIFGKRIIGTLKYEVKNVLDSSTLRVSLNGHHNYSTVSKNEILAALGLAVKFSSPRTNLSGRWQLDHFQVIFVYNTGREHLMIEGNLFNDKFKKLVEKLGANDMVIFRNMETRLSDNRIIKLEPYVIFIKE